MESQTSITIRLNQLASFMKGEKLSDSRIELLNHEAFLYGLHEEFSQVDLDLDRPFDNCRMAISSENFYNLQEAVLN